MSHWQSGLATLLARIAVLLAAPTMKLTLLQQQPEHHQVPAGDRLDQDEQ